MTPNTVTPTTGRVLQRACAACDEGKKKELRRKATGPATGEVPDSVYEALRAPGQPLDAATRAFMEPRFRHDFSRVRVHTDAKAAASARAVEARAYTYGSDIVFDRQRYSPTTGAGRELIAHELTHVVQQGGARDFGSGPLTVAPASDGAELAAERMAKTVDAGIGIARAPLHPSHAAAGMIWRSCDQPEKFYRDSPRFCRDGTFSTSTHAGKTCYREIMPEDAEGCPPGDHCCFGPDGEVEDSRDASSLAEGRESDGTCNWNMACVIKHTVTDFLPAVTGLDCFAACRGVSGPGKFWCLQSCSARKH